MTLLMSLYIYDAISFYMMVPSGIGVPAFICLVSVCAPATADHQGRSAFYKTLTLLRNWVSWLRVPWNRLCGCWRTWALQYNHYQILKTWMDSWWREEPVTWPEMLAMFSADSQWTAAHLTGTFKLLTLNWIWACSYFNSRRSEKYFNCLVREINDLHLHNDNPNP